MSLVIRKVKENETSSLSNLAIRSKTYWGYSAEFMLACETELLITKNKFESDKFLYMVAESKGEQLGYYALEKISESEVELEALFVDPVHIGSGIGRALLIHAKKVAAKMGGVTLIIQGDPNDTLQVIGVLKNFHWNSLNNAQVPRLFMLEREYIPYISYFFNPLEILRIIFHV